MECTDALLQAKRDKISPASGRTRLVRSRFSLSFGGKHFYVMQRRGKAFVGPHWTGRRCLKEFGFIISSVENENQYRRTMTSLVLVAAVTAVIVDFGELLDHRS